MFHYLKQALYIFKPFDRAFLSEYGLHTRMVHYATAYFNVGANCVFTYAKRDWDSESTTCIVCYYWSTMGTRSWTALADFVLGP